MIPAIIAFLLDVIAEGIRSRRSSEEIAERAIDAALEAGVHHARLVAHLTRRAIEAAEREADEAQARKVGL